MQIKWIMSHFLHNLQYRKCLKLLIQSNRLKIGYNLIFHSVYNERRTIDHLNSFFIIKSLFNELSTNLPIQVLHSILQWQERANQYQGSHGIYRCHIDSRPRSNRSPHNSDIFQIISNWLFHILYDFLCIMFDILCGSLLAIAWFA